MSFMSKRMVHLVAGKSPKVLFQSQAPLIASSHFLSSSSSSVSSSVSSSIIKNHAQTFHSTAKHCDAETVQITFIDPLEKEHKVNAEIGKSLLDVAHDNNVELEGACGGELACATCHLIFSQDIYDTLPEKEPEEDDMLDLAFELTDT